MLTKNIIMQSVFSFIERMCTVVYTGKEESLPSKQKFFRNRGFTLAELLIVVAIIGMLSAAIVSQMANTRARTRDVTREKSIKTLQDAFEIYFTNQRFYPITTAPLILTGADAVSVILLSNDAIHTVPKDPLNTGNYQYIYDSPDGTTYTITYYLETDAVPGKAAGIQTASP